MIELIPMVVLMDRLAAQTPSSLGRTENLRCLDDLDLNFFSVRLGKS